MKKSFFVFTIAILSLLFNSCSSDSEDGPSIVFKTRGIQKNFTVSAQKNTNIISVYGYTGNQSNPTESISFQFDATGTGINRIRNFIYVENGKPYANNGRLYTKIVKNTSNDAWGIFYGNLEGEGSIALEMSEGKFSVKF